MLYVEMDMVNFFIEVLSTFSFANVIGYFNGAAVVDVGLCRREAGRIYDV